MSFAREIGLVDELEKRFSHLKKRKRGYSVSEKILSFVEMLIKGKDLSMAGFSLFRHGNASPSANNLSLLRKLSTYLKEDNPGVKLTVRLDSAGYNHRIMRYCDTEGHEFLIAGDKYEIVLDTIAAIDEGKWEKLRGSALEEEVAESVHFVGPEKGGKVYSFVVLRRKNNQLALFPEFQYSYRVYFTNTDWDKHEVVHFYRKRGDAENVIKEEKEGFEEV